MQIHCLPIARPDETLYSVGARLRLANAARNDRDACRSLFGPSPNMRVSEFPVNLVHFCSVTQNSFGDPQRVLDSMTLAGFFERLDSRPWHAGSGNQPIVTAGYGLAALSNGSAGRWRACMRCIENDLAYHATSFWRRSHHLPTGFLCPVHEIPLARYLAPPFERHNRFMLPEENWPDMANGDMDWIAHHQDLMRLNTLGIDVLEDERQPINAYTARAALFGALGDRGLVTATGMLRSVQFAGEFAHRYRILNRHPDFCLALSPKGIHILQRGLSIPGAKRSAAHNLLLIDWLFGSWQAFHQHCLWQATMDNSTGIEVDLAKSWGSRTSGADAASPYTQARPKGQRQHRQICLDFLLVHTAPTRSRFARAAPASFRWLLRYDMSWFESCLPRVYAERCQGSLF